MPQSQAERLRRHREEMELALQLKVTPREARAILDQRAARARWEETHRLLMARMQGKATPHAEAGHDLGPAQPWYREGSMA